MLDMIFHNCFENLINISVYAYVDIFISLKKKRKFALYKEHCFLSILIPTKGWPLPMYIQETLHNTCI